jgi:SRSO17 transposase
VNLREAGSRFAAFIQGLVSVIGHADRAGPLRDYCTGLVMPCERKSVEPMAAITAPDRTAAQHQSLLHFVGQSPWSDEKVLAKVGEMVLPAIERHGPIEAWIIDDTGFPKQGEHSVGVARQYCGQLGKQDLCSAENYVLGSMRARGRWRCNAITGPHKLQRPEESHQSGIAAPALWSRRPTDIAQG